MASWPQLHCSSTKSAALLNLKNCITNKGCTNMKPIKTLWCACQIWHLMKQTRDLSPLVLFCWPPLQSWAPSRQGCQVTFGSMSLIALCACRRGQGSCRPSVHVWQCLLNSSPGGEWWESWSLWNFSLQLPSHNLTHSWAHPQACP